MSHQHTLTIQFLVGPDKVNEATRYDRGLKITSQAPQSVICAQHPDLLAAASVVIKDNDALKVALDAYTTTEAAFATARTTLATTVINWDASYDVFVTTGEKYSTTPNDAATLGAVARGTNIYPLVMPLSVDFKWDAKKNRARIHVHRAPGMNVVGVQVSTDPITPTSWYELEGNGAIHILPNPAKGTMWARAQSRTAKGKSDFTAPVSVIVK